MLGISHAIWIRKEILDYLDNENRFITTYELSERFPYVSQSTLKKLCKDFHEGINRIYPNGEVVLEVSQRDGFWLHRHNINLSALYSDFFANEIEMILCAEILKKRSFNTENFIMEYGISESQFRRRVKDLNQYLSDLEINITVAREVHIKGSEDSIRNFHFTFLYFCLNNLPTVPWLKEYEVYLQDVALFVKSYGYNMCPGQQEIFAMWIYINVNAQMHKADITYSEIGLKVIDNFPEIEKPAFLSILSDENWKFLMFSAYVWDVFDLNIKPDLNYLKTIVDSTLSDYWIDSFEEVIRPLNKDEKNFLYTRYFKNVMAKELFKVNDATMASLRLIDLEDVRGSYPYYMEKYDEFIENFNQKTDQFDSNYFKNAFFLSFNYLVPFNAMRKKIKIFMFAGLTSMTVRYQRDRLNMYLMTRYDIAFVTKMEEADLLISSRPINKKYIIKGQQYFEMNGSLTRQEIYRIEEVLQDL